MNKDALLEMFAVRLHSIRVPMARLPLDSVSTDDVLMDTPALTINVADPLLTLLLVKSRVIELIRMDRA